MWTCQCASVDTAEHRESLEAFASVRDRCAALKEILIPDRIWPDYERFCSSDRDEACHAPIAYLAFVKRHLASLTEPIHEFCLVDGAPHPLLTEQYKKDLIENWMCPNNVKERFERAKIFFGRLWELVFAYGLRKEGWRVGEIEALGGPSDVVATDPSGLLSSFEIKFLGKEELMFDLEVSSLKGESTFRYMSVYSPQDYLLFRVYEASRQLNCAIGNKVVVSIIEEYEGFQLSLSEHWIKWNKPSFFREDDDIKPLLNREYAKNPSLDHDIECYISQIDQIWFYDISNGMALRRRHIDSVHG